MNLKKAVVEIDEIVYNQVIIDVDKMRIGQRLTLPEQENPEVKQFEGIQFFTSEIDKGPGGPDTIVYKIRTTPPKMD